MPGVGHELQISNYKGILTMYFRVTNLRLKTIPGNQCPFIQGGNGIKKKSGCLLFQKCTAFKILRLKIILGAQCPLIKISGCLVFWSA